MPIGTPENIDYFKNAPSDATHYVCVGGERTFYKQDTGYIHKFIETLTNQGIHGTTYTQVTVNTASLSPVENKQEIQHKDLKQLKELLDSEINNWFNKLS